MASPTASVASATRSLALQLKHQSAVEEDEHGLAFVHVAENAFGTEMLQFELAQRAGREVAGHLGFRSVVLDADADRDAGNQGDHGGGPPGEPHPGASRLSIRPQAEG